MKNGMKIGIFDSGLGGLIIARAIRQAMPEYDYVYLGDTKRVPYGNRSHNAVYEFTREGVDYLFKKENCAIVIVACNTASARALRQIQQKYLIKNFPNRKVLGVLIPTAEECAKYQKVGIIGTAGTVASNTFPREIAKLHTLRNFSEAGKKKTNPASPRLRRTSIFQNPAPMLVPLAEEGEKILAKQFLIKYLKPLLAKKPDAIALGCTHYPFFKTEIRKIIKEYNPIRTNGGSKRPPASNGTRVISQDEIIPKKLKEYFVKHPEIENKLSKGKTAKILVTDITKNVTKLTQNWFGKNSKPKLIKL